MENRSPASTAVRSASKWVSRIELMTADKRGFSEERGYSNTAYPWRNGRYG